MISSGLPNWAMPPRFTIKTLSDKVLIVNRGGIAQFGRPEEIIEHPADSFVKEFILNQLEIKKNNIFTLFRQEQNPAFMMQAV